MYEFVNELPKITFPTRLTVISNVTPNKTGSVRRKNDLSQILDLMKVQTNNNVTISVKGRKVFVDSTGSKT